MENAASKKRDEPSARRVVRLTRSIKFRVDAEQERALLEQAAQAGLSVSDLVRRAVLAVSPPPRRRAKTVQMDERAFALALAALGKIGTNLNQIARVSNTQKHVSFEEFRLLKNLQNELRETRAALLQCFGEDE